MDIGCLKMLNGPKTGGITKVQRCGGQVLTEIFRGTAFSVSGSEKEEVSPWKPHELLRCLSQLHKLFHG